MATIHTTEEELPVTVSATSTIPNASGGDPVTPSNETILDRSYPISRPLYMYTNGEPAGAVKEYIDWILGDAGQRVLRDRGYSPVRPL